MRQRRWLPALVLALAFVVAAGAVFAQSYGRYELDRAKEAMNRGDYRYAIDQFRYIEGNYRFSEAVRREAAYFVGFCYVRMNDIWSAVRAYESFLDRYDNGSRVLIPDALYSVGRAHEELRQIDNAVRYYRRCIDRFPGNEFASKSRDRLRLLGYDYGGDYPGGGGYGDYDVSPQVYDMIQLAKMTNNAYEADQMLLKAGRKARRGADFIAISKAMRNDFNRGELFTMCANSEVFMIMHCLTIVDLVKTSRNAYQRDELLLTAARRRAQRAEDFRVLAEATTNAYTRSEILRIAQEKIGGGGYPGPHYSMDEMTSVDEMPAAPKSKGAKVTSDPFHGFSSDRARIDRINAFIDAIKAKQGVDAAAKQLTREDLRLDVVRESMSTWQQNRQFEQLHQPGN